MFRSFDPNDATAQVWNTVLGPYSSDDVERALRDYLTVGKFPPVPADIIERCKAFEATRLGELTPDKLWTISFGVAGQLYTKEPLKHRLRLAGIPPSQVEACARAVCSLGIERLQLMDLESDDLAFARKDFLAIVQREEKAAETTRAAAVTLGNPMIKQLINSIKTIQ